MGKNLIVFFIGLIGLIFLLPSCHLIGKREAKNTSSEKRGIAAGKSSFYYGRGVRPKSNLAPVFSFRRIPKGEFEMGSPRGERGRYENEAQKPVEISKAFEIMETEVTQKQWFQVTGRNPSFFKRSGDCDNWDRVNVMCPDNPVERVSWNDVQGFIKTLNDFMGLRGCKGSPKDPSGCYRLPTEAEWEWAVRAKTKTAYFYGNNPSKLGRYAIYVRNSERGTHKVKGDRLPNRWGLYDVYGNVWEWVQDGYRSELPGGRDPLLTNGSARVVRGGGWFSRADGLRSALRFGDYPGRRYRHFGFRLVRML